MKDPYISVLEMEFFSMYDLYLYTFVFLVSVRFDTLFSSDVSLFTPFSFPYIN